MEARRRVRATVAICTIGRPELLKQSLPQARAAADAAGDVELIVVEQRGRTAEDIAARVGARYVADSGRGVSRARNVAARAAASDVVLYTDDDCLVPSSWVVDHLAALEDAAVDGSFGVVADLPRDAGHDDPAAVVKRHDPTSPPWAVGHSSNMAIRVAKLLAVGGFDERIGPGSRGVQAGEDADVISRLLAAGATLVSGTGEPVHHIAWRSTDEAETTLTAYERGAGVWLGAALRAKRPYAARHARSRARMLRQRVAERLRSGRRTEALQLVAGFASGIGRGVLLRPWERAAR